MISAKSSTESKATDAAVSNSFKSPMPPADEEDLEDDQLTLEVVKKCLGMEDGEQDTETNPSINTGAFGSRAGFAAISARSIQPPSFSFGLSFQFRPPRYFMWLCENKVFTGIFMFLTFYALFVPDLDQLCGNKTSREFFLILNTIVCLSFIIEIIVMSLGKDQYFLRPYFWLDTIALVSMIPDTWVVQQIVNTGSDGFVQGRSSRIARIIRVASRSSKATRMNRITRVARVASLLPKFSQLFGHNVTDQEVKTVLNKKLNRVFRLFDDDMDGRVARVKVNKFLDSLKVNIKRNSDRQQKGSLSLRGSRNSTASHMSSYSIDGKLSTSEKSGSESQPVGRVPSSRSDGGAKGRSSDNDAPYMSETRSQGTDSEKVARKVRTSRINVLNADEEDDSETVGFQEFSEMLLQDPVVGPCLRSAVDMQLRRRTNTKNITTRHSEYVAVRVALGVIVLLFLLGLASRTEEDKAIEMGLDHLIETMRHQYPSTTEGDAVPVPIHDQVHAWSRNYPESRNRKVVWLDIEKFVYCDAFRNGASNCTWDGVATTYWSKRISLKNIYDIAKDSDYRMGDLSRIGVPWDDDDISDDERNRRTNAFAVVDQRWLQQQKAAMSICVTFLVLIVVMSGIFLLTQDLTQMSSMLLRPLRELADDMESLTQLQLAGAEDAEEDKKGKGTDEIRQIRNTFEKMKKAIKSWGKYVPWPVVQMLLRANVEADLKVEEVEASMYFSDIAGFTTIVESLQPEKSLLLLNRYFNDMTKVIDDHGGVVIEFIGDAILCIYGAPLVNPYHPSAAVKGALRMLASLRRLNAWSVTKGLPQVSIRCGVHTGKVLVGNMGFQTRMKYGIVGEDSQIPGRLEELNKTYSTNCLISRYTYTQLIDNMFLARPVDYIRLRHAPNAEPEQIYQVMDRERNKEKVHPNWEVVDLQFEAMELYLDRQFEEANTKFQAAGDLYKELNDCESDPPSEQLAKRCQSYMKDPPPEDWDGVWNRSE